MIYDNNNNGKVLINQLGWENDMTWLVAIVMKKHIDQHDRQFKHDDNDDDND